MFDLEIGR